MHEFVGRRVVTGICLSLLITQLCIYTPGSMTGLHLDVTCRIGVIGMLDQPYDKPHQLSLYCTDI